MGDIVELARRKDGNKNGRFIGRKRKGKDWMDSTDGLTGVWLLHTKYMFPANLPPFLEAGSPNLPAGSSNSEVEFAR